MRQFILGKNTAYGTSVPLSDGTVAFTTLKNGVPTIDKTGEEVLKGHYYISVGTKYGTKSIAGSVKNFSFVKSVYAAGRAYAGNITIPAVSKDGDYTLILTKKGKKFNERSNWTVSVPVRVGDVPATIATALKNQFENNKVALNITPSTSGATLNIAGIDKHEDFMLIAADDLVGTTVTNTEAQIPTNDAVAIKNMLDKAGADMGFSYTYYDVDVNPGYPVNPLEGKDAADTGFTVFTLRFAVPRDVKTVDEVVNQIVQIAFPTGTSAITDFEKVCKAIVDGKATQLP